MPPTEQRVVAVVQARVGSIRLPGKVTHEVLGEPLLVHLVERLSRAENLDQIVVAIPDTPSNDGLADVCDEAGIAVFRGSESDVLDRTLLAAREHGASVVVRVTGDCPLIDPGTVDLVVDTFAAHPRAAIALTGPSYPDGMDVEVTSMEELTAAWENATDANDREHVTPFIRRSAGHNAVVVDMSADHSALRLTVDEPEDLLVIDGVFHHFGRNEFSVEDILKLHRQSPELFQANSQHPRNAGAHLGTGEKLWQRAKRVIPGGNSLLSKRSELFLPIGWPAYFQSAKGVTVTDLDGREYADVGLMGVGTNILGYGYPSVDEAVRKAVSLGNLSSLNCPEEVVLAERLVELHPWASMARFTRSGGEACAVAARISRSATGRSKIAFCGYHGWHDWYLAANLAEGDALDEHLLPGLSPLGVPRGLGGSAIPFHYNDLEGLREILSNGDIASVYMEVERSEAPQPGFLQGARRLANEFGAVLVFDECTSGFRRTLGGLHLDYGVNPDLAVFGKTLGNGYAIAAVIGRQEVMEASQDSFISSTFWTERIGPTAALASLKAMKEEAAPQRVDEIGLTVRSRWTQIAAEVGLDLSVFGLPALGSYAVNGLDPVAVRTLVTGEMLAAGYLAGTSLYASIKHTDDVLERYFERLAPVFGRLATLSSPEDIWQLLPDGPAQSGFARLT